MIERFSTFKTQNFRDGNANIVSNNYPLGTRFIIVNEQSTFEHETEFTLTELSEDAEVIKFGKSEHSLSFVNLLSNVGKQYKVYGNASLLNSMFDVVEEKIIEEETIVPIKDEVKVDGKITTVRGSEPSKMSKSAKATADRMADKLNKRMADLEKKVNVVFVV